MEEKKEKKENFQSKRKSKRKERKFPIKEWEKAKGKERKFPTKEWEEVKVDNNRKKVLGLSNKQAHAYEDISLINHAFVFYIVAQNTKPRSLISLD